MISEKIEVVMTGTGGNQVIDIPQTSPPVTWLNIINLTDNVLYIVKVTDTDSSNPYYVFGPYTTLSVIITPDIATNFKVIYDNPGLTNLNLLKRAQIIFSDESLGFNQNYATAFAYSKGSLGMTIQNTPAVNATITGTANVNVANTPNVAITSGNVNAMIQNAQLNSKVINQLLAQNNLVLIASGTISVSNLANGAYQAINTDYLSQLNGGVSYIPNLGAYDGLLIVVISNNGINWSANGFPLNPTGLYAHYLNIALTNFLNSTTATTGKIAKIVRQIQMPSGGTNALLLWYDQTYTFNIATCAIQNNSGATITSDTLVVYYYGVKSIQEVDRGGTYSASTGIFTLNNATYTQIFATSASYPTLLRKLILGTSPAITNNFYISMGTSSTNSVAILNINTTVQSTVYDLTPGITIPAGNILYAYQSSGSTVQMECTLIVQ